MLGGLGSDDSSPGQIRKCIILESSLQTYYLHQVVGRCMLPVVRIGGIIIMQLLQE